MREKIKVLLDIVRKLEETSKEAAGKSKSAANELSAGLVSSYSMAGDVEHAKNSANLSIQKHASIKKLANELEDAAVLDIPTMVQSGCYIKIEMSGIKKELYLVNNPVYISGHSLVSPASPIGEALLGKKPGDLFLYKSGDQTFTGKILEIG